MTRRLSPSQPARRVPIRGHQKYMCHRWLTWGTADGTVHGGLFALLEHLKPRGPKKGRSRPLVGNGWLHDFAVHQMTASVASLAAIQGRIMSVQLTVARERNGIIPTLFKYRMGVFIGHVVSHSP